MILTKFKSTQSHAKLHNDMQDVIRENCLPLEVVPLTASNSSCVPSPKSTPSLYVLNSSVSKYRVIEPEQHSSCDHSDYSLVHISCWFCGF